MGTVVEPGQLPLVGLIPISCIPTGPRTPITRQIAALKSTPSATTAGRYWESAEMGVEAKLDALAKRVEALEAKLTPPAPRRWQTVGFDRPLPRAAVAAAAFKMPSDAELTRLMAAFHAAHPQLADLAGLVERGDDAIDAEFINYKGDIRKASSPSSSASLSSLCRTSAARKSRTHGDTFPLQDEAAAILAGLGQAGEVLKFNPFVTAALAHGDICYSGLGMAAARRYRSAYRVTAAPRRRMLATCTGFWAPGDASAPREARPDRHGQQPVTVTRL